MNWSRAALSGIVCGVLAAGGILALNSCGNSSAAPADVSSPHVVGKTKEEIGRYLILVGGCNDCHTPGAMEGNLPAESEWLTGIPLGFNGPWGTTYAANLRLKVQLYPTEDTFVKAMRIRNLKPPMPWAALHSMTDADLGAVYVFIKSLGATGKMVPEAVPPGVEPQGPYVVMAPPIVGKGPGMAPASQPASH